jgi:RNA polymerase sigma-70 factor (ECF subfamily)
LTVATAVGILSSVVTARRLPDDEPSGRQPGTLGDLLYGDRARAPVPEREWVALVQSIGAGDQRALHELYERTHRIVFTLSVRITNDRETADEVTLDVFHDVWRRAVSYDPAGGSVIGWLMNQARSRAIDRVRFEQRKKRVDPHLGDPLAASPPPDPAQLCDLKEQGRHVRDALRVLSPDERRVIETAFFSEMTYGEVAARLNQPLGTVKTRIRAALLKLRQVLARTVKAS